MRSIRPVYFLLLVIALLCAQLGGLTHGIAHAWAEQTQDQSQPSDKLCDLCAAYAQVGSALSSTPLALNFGAQAIFFVPLHFASASSSLFSAFAARAPPRNS